MRMLKNNVQLIGNLGADPEVRKVGQNKRVLKISLATTDFYRDASGERKSSTEWHQIIVWDKLAEIVERMCTKGSEIAVSGRLTHRSYTEKSGDTRYITEIVATEVMVFNTRRDPVMA